MHVTCWSVDHLLHSHTISKAKTRKPPARGMREDWFHQAGGYPSVNEDFAIAWMIYEYDDLLKWNLDCSTS